MLTPSLNLSPTAWVLLALSEPARSTRWNLHLQTSSLLGLNQVLAPVSDFKAS